MHNAAYLDGLDGDLISVWTAVFQRQKAFAEHAMRQLDDGQFLTAIAPGLNSVGVIAQHLAGNMLSRWTDFLTTDGEKPTRSRDAEFEPPAGDPAAARAEITRAWDRAWATLFATLEQLSPDDLPKTITIRGAPHTVHAAIARQLDHYAFHVGQMNVIARVLVGSDRWQWFTLPPGGTAAFNAMMHARAAERPGPSGSA